MTTRPRGNKQPLAPGVPDLPGLAAPARRALAAAGLGTLAQLAQKPEAEIAALHGMGPAAMATLRAALAARRLAFRKPAQPR